MLLTKLWLGVLYTFKIWLDEYFLNSWYCNCERKMKMFQENVNVLSDETFLWFVSKKVNNNLEITFVCSALYLMKLSHIPYSIILVSMEWFSLNKL